MCYLATCAVTSVTVYEQCSSDEEDEEVVCIYKRTAKSYIGTL